ncbi:hypothetical protein [Melittangium boletus]|uniref:Lipoprotein n=1 Tax=Melittangium boletus DSM 14713 TaxID=1294270 RepID=A0A250ICJ3_9BACT|nr:hypothetical protein [Melittangium boletus]ATB28676.1 hypothetical protein MEBOL_002125 [Melittangium boletus DSM 14713]
MKKTSSALMIAASLSILPACGIEETNTPELQGSEAPASSDLGQTGSALSVGSYSVNLSAHGGSGGAASSKECPANYVAVGIHGSAGDIVVSLGLVCRYLNNDGTLGAWYYTSATTGAYTVTPFNIQCPAGQVVVGFHGHNNNFLDSLGLSCATPNNWMSGSGVEFSTVKVGGTGGGYEFSDLCPPQYVVRKLNLRSWDLIDQAQAVCNSLMW